MSAQQKLLDAIDRLEELVAEGAPARPPTWRAQAEQALVQIEHALNKHAREIAKADGQLVIVDRPLVPSPTAQHRGRQLQSDLHYLRDETRALRQRIHASAPEMGAGVDVTSFCKLVRHLVEALERFENREASLILESVNTDIGAGD